MDSDEVRERLGSEKERVQELIHQIKGELSDGRADQELADYDQHPADSGSDTFEREKDLSILEQLENEVVEVEAALARVDEGTYGIDERTGEPISPDRLEAMPTARTNVAEGD